MMNAFTRSVFTFLTVSICAAGAQAAEGDPLAGAPAVRHRHELRSRRFEVGPSFGFTLNRSYRHAFLVGGKLEYHITDYLSVGGEAAAGVNFDAGLVGEIEQSYAGQQAEFAVLRSRLSDIQMAGDVRVVFTPFTGKLNLFSALFLAYDFYGFAGYGMALLSNGIDDAGTDATNEGFRSGFAWGIGVHLFANKFVSVGIELKDLLFSDNQTGQDLTRGLTDAEQAAGGNPIIDGDDTSFEHHFIASLNATFFWPMQVAISR